MLAAMSPIAFKFPQPQLPSSKSYYPNGGRRLSPIDNAKAHGLPLRSFGLGCALFRPDSVPLSLPGQNPSTLAYHLYSIELQSKPAHGTAEQAGTNVSTRPFCRASSHLKCGQVGMYVWALFVSLGAGTFFLNLTPLPPVQGCPNRPARNG